MSESEVEAAVLVSRGRTGYSSILYRSWWLDCHSFENFEGVLDYHFGGRRGLGVMPTYLTVGKLSLLIQRRSL